MDYDERKRKLVCEMNRLLDENDGDLCPSGNDESRVFYSYYFGSSEMGTLMEVYRNPDFPTEIIVVTDYNGYNEDGEEGYDHTRFDEFSNDEMETILKMVS